jgi:hypothetical protein
VHQHKAGENEEGGYGFVASTDELEDGRGQRGSRMGQGLAGSCEVVQDDPEGQQEAQSGQRGQMGRTN